MKDNFRDLTRGKGAWGRPSRYRPPRRPVVVGPSRVQSFPSSPLLLGLPLSPFEVSVQVDIRIFVLSSESWYTSSRCLSFVLRSKSWYISSRCLFLFVSNTVYLFLYQSSIPYIEWELQAPSRTRFLGGQLRRSRDRVFIVRDVDFGLKTGYDKIFLKKTPRGGPLHRGPL